MKHNHSALEFTPTTIKTLFSLAAFLAAAIACSGQDGDEAGSSAAGGSSGTGMATGGDPGSATGGTSASGGASGAAGTGGTSATGGSGGTSATGGTAGSAGSETGGTAGSTGGTAGTGGSSGSAGSATGGTGGSTVVDECNTTAECKSIYGPEATDCVNSQSDQSWCDCGGTPCASGTGGSGGSGGSTGGSGGSTGGSGGSTGGSGGSTGGSGGGTTTGDCELSGELRLWHKVSVTCDGPQTGEQANPNPFRDYRMDVTFTNGSKTLVVPGHFAADGAAANSGATSGDQWRVHFMPVETGTWTYTVAFRQGSNVITGGINAGTPVAGIDGAQGTFSVSTTDKSGRDMRAKGLLEYVGGHYLRFAGTGKYFLKQGPDAPENFLAYKDFDGDFKSDGISDKWIKSWSAHVGDWNSGDPTWSSGKGKGIIGAINYLASEGLNSFSFIPMNIQGDDKNCFPYTSYDERYRIDVSRMDQWEIVFAHGTKKGMFLHFKTQETENELLLDNGNMGTQRTLYYRELISRFAHHPALNWNLGEEINNASTSQKSAWASYFWDTDPYRHHIVIHNGDNHYDLMGTAHDLTGFSLQTGLADFSDVHSKVLNYLKRSASEGKPWAVACDEPGDAQHALRPAGDEGNSWTDGRKNGIWGTLLAGGWGNEWYFGYAHDHSDLTCEDFRSRDGFWDFARHALAFFEDNDIPFWEMKNDNALSSASNDYCFYKHNDTYVVYLKSGGQTSLNLNGASGTYQVRWFDPRNGGNLKTGSVTSVTGGGSRNLGTAPSNTSADWVVLVRK